MKAAIENDIKAEDINSILPPVFGQLALWDKEYIIKNKEVIYNTLNNIGNKWMINIICLKEGKSYIVAKDIEVKKNLEILFNKKFNEDIMEFNEVWLRKEIIKMARESINTKK